MALEFIMQEKILKLLNLATSSNDYEALTALRAANAILKKNNMLWDTFFHFREAKTENVNCYQGYKYNEVDIEEMLDVCLNEVQGSASDFIESLHNFYEKKGYLTEKQQRALRKFYDNVT